jgi:G3E family GTPase
VIVNKTDLHDEDTLRRTEDEIRVINAGVRMVRSQYGRVDMDVFGERPAPRLEGQYARCLDPNFSVTTVRITEAVDIDHLAAALEPLRNDVYRVKGFVPSAGGWRYIDLSSGGLTIQPAAPSAPGSLVFIAPPAIQPRIDQLAADIRGGGCASEKG